MAEIKAVPVYKHSAGIARQNDELEAYRSSRKLNIACGEAIDQAIKENSTPGPSAGTQYVDSAQAARSVIAEFGAERVAWVLAANIQAADWDGRFSNSTKAWAKGLETSGKPDVYLNTHRSILDGFVHRFREVAQEQPSITAALSAGAEKSRRAFGNTQPGNDAPKKSTGIEV